MKSLEIHTAQFGAPSLGECGRRHRSAPARGGVPPFLPEDSDDLADLILLAGSQDLHGLAHFFDKRKGGTELIRRAPPTDSDLEVIFEWYARAGGGARVLCNEQGGGGAQRARGPPDQTLRRASACCGA